MSENGIWIFQTLVQEYRFRNLLKDHLTGNLKTKGLTWRAKQFKEQIKAGDLALVWIGGNAKAWGGSADRGIYAVLDVLSGVYDGIEFDGEEYYRLPNPIKERGPLVTVQIKHNLVNDPLLSSDLREIKELEEMSILTVRQGTNHKVTKDEWDILKPLVEDKIGRLI
jgi:EVE domain